MEFYYPSEHLSDPLNENKHFQSEDISSMLEYLESSSMDRQFSFDGSQVLSQDIAYTN
jgi:hypothetical protein